MTDPSRKICLIGEFGVGKTSLVARYVRNTFSERYLTTVGVKVDTRNEVVDAVGPVKLVIWDIAGKTGLDSVSRPYLQGASALVLVADGTRARSIATACTLLEQALAVLPDATSVLLLNKLDLLDEWEVGMDIVNALRARMPVFLTSALNGSGVAEAFRHVASEVMRDRA
jgi:hypothetical protein